MVVAENMEILEREVQRAVRTTRGVFFSVDEGDLRQEAWQAALEACATYKPGRGVGLGAYVGQAMRWRLGNYALKVLQPISFPNNGRARAVIADMSPQRVSNGGPGFERHVSTVITVRSSESLLDEKRTRVRTVALMIRALGGREKLREALVGNPEEPAVRVLHQKLAADPELRQLWNEREEP